MSLHPPLRISLDGARAQPLCCRPEVPVWLLRLAVLPPLLSLGLQAKLERPALCERASLVVIGEVTGFDTQWAADGSGTVERVFDLSTERVLRGEPPAGPLRVRVPGGSLGGGLNYIAEDAPELRVDHRYLLLLAPDGDAFRVVGLQQGALPLAADGGGDEAALRSLGGCLAK